MTGLSLLAMLAVCGFGSYLIVTDEQRGRQASAAVPRPTALPKDISSRAADPAPLTVAEVYPSNSIVISPAEPGYRLLRTQASDDCAVATSGGVADLLRGLGCSQVVRGTLKSPNGRYLVTAGVFNLPDAAAADRAHAALKALVDSGKGRFTGLAAGKGTEPVALSSAQVGWHVRGHFLVYCVIARADRTEIRNGDPYARQILFDIIELHLRNGVLERRAFVPAEGPTGSHP
ncbi:MAG TPA: hypothetical protein VF462_05895 [Micromonosporaceae bacterium]